MAASAAGEYRYMEVSPVLGPDPYSAEALAAAIRSTSLPPGDNEQREKAALRERGWKNPCGLKAYSHAADYPDLYAYFDADDKTSPVNIAASTALKCYGLNGAQRVQDWDEIRGPCIVVRQEPPTSPFTTSSWGNSGPSVHNAEYKPLISVDEMVQTLLYFKDKDARQIAMKRDAQRLMGSIPAERRPAAGSGGMYVGPAGNRNLSKVAGKDAETCAACGKFASIAGALKRCSACQDAWYCDGVCQKKDYKVHKAACKRKAAKLAAQKAAAGQAT